MVPIPKKKIVVVKYENEKVEKAKKLDGWWNTTPHYSKRRNGAWICQKCKKKGKCCLHPWNSATMGIDLSFP